jgi:hypothetical protein
MKRQQVFLLPGFVCFLLFLVVFAFLKVVLMVLFFVIHDLSLVSIVWANDRLRQRLITVSSEFRQRSFVDVPRL